MPNASDQFADRILTNAIEVASYEEGVRRDVVGFLQTMQDDLIKQIRDMDAAGVERTTYRRARVEKLLEQVKATLKDGYKTLDGKLREHLTDLSKVQAEAIVVIGQEILTSSIFTTALTPLDLKVLVSDTLIDGSPAKDWWARQEVGTRMNVAREIRLGYAAGENNDSIIARIIGKKSGRQQVMTINGERTVVPVYEGGVMNMARRQAEALVRTSVQTISNQVMLETYKANDDVIRGVEAIATLDNRTTPICIARDRAAWNLATGEALPESTISEPFPGPPPWHWRCRTVLVPIVKSWEELVKEASGQTFKFSKVPLDVRASMDGQVTSMGKTTYEGWLKTKSEKFARSVLGDGKYDLWSSGKIQLGQLISPAGEPLSLDALKKVAAGQRGIAQRVH